MGSDCAALALDASDSIEAENSLEKMLAHQMAIAHKISMEIANQGMLEADAISKVKLLNLASRFMETYQKGMLTLQRLRTGGDQRITVQYVNVAEGGQAIVGNVKTGGRKK